MSKHHLLNTFPSVSFQHILFPRIIFFFFQEIYAVGASASIPARSKLNQVIAPASNASNSIDAAVCVWEDHVETSGKTQKSSPMLEHDFRGQRSKLDVQGNPPFGVEGCWM